MKTAPGTSVDHAEAVFGDAVRLVGVKVRNRGEVKKLDSADVPLRNGDPVLIEVAKGAAHGEAGLGVLDSG